MDRLSCLGLITVFQFQLLFFTKIDIATFQFNAKNLKMISHFFRKRILITFDHLSETFPVYLKLCGRSGRNRLLSPPVLLGCNGFPDTRFSRGTTRLMSWPDGVRYLRLSLSLVVSLLSPFVSTLVFSRTGGILSHRSILTSRFPRFPPRNLCSLVMLAVFSLVFAATDTAFF